MTKAEKIRQNERIRKRYTNFFKPLLEDIIRDQIREYTDILQSRGVQAVQGNAPNLIDPALTALIQQLYVRAGIARAELTYRSLRRLPKVQQKKTPLGFNAEWTNDILNYFRLNLFNKVVLPIAETTKADIERILSIGVAQGWSIDQMVKEIEKRDYLDGRVETILRTELTRAINYGNEVAARSYDFQTQKGWISVHDSHTRHAHLRADGQVVGIDSSFSVGGEQLDFPGDPNGSAGNTINCRCMTEIIPVRDNRGRLLPKEPQPVKVTGQLRRDVQDILRQLS